MAGRRWIVPAAWVGAAALGLVVGFWAARATLTTPATVDQGQSFALYTVPEGTVGRVVTFTTEARWDPVPLAPNASMGTITTVAVGAGDDVVVGKTLYSVDLRPVTAAIGDVPAFRDLRTGARGVDVEQLQRFLTAVGHYRGALSGEFDGATSSAVRAWQRSVGIDDDGVVRRSDLLFLPAATSRVTPGPALRVGAQLAGGEVVVEALSAAPVFTVTLGPDQADLVPLDADVLVHHGDQAWQGRISSSITSATGDLVLGLKGPAGTPLCGDRCGEVPVAPAAVYRVDVIVVPETTGPVVPVSALRTRPDGTVTVVADDGREVTITISAASDGRVVVMGIDVGAVIRLFGTTPGAGASAAPAHPK